MVTDTSNINFQLAADLIQHTNRSVFLTGKAGTGKTTFLKYIREQVRKQTAVIAPTGVAAINAGGVTIHSFFQLPFSPFVPGSNAPDLFNANHTQNHGESNDKQGLIAKLRFNKDRIKILQELELLVIDEISMVRCDILDAIDTILKHFRSRYFEPFGGVQILLIGDMHQLPPVVGDTEWQILQNFYQGPYFFNSKIMEEHKPAYVELDKIYRQRDERFIDLLNRVRNNDLNEEASELLHQYYQPNFKPVKDDGYITLTTHNRKADTINAEEIENLKGKVYSFKATITGDFSEKSYPADEVMQLKIGAQVMFIKNDVGANRKYFNGKIGKIESIDEDKIIVNCKDEPEMIEVKKETWRNIRYTMNNSNRQIEEDEIGSFSQYPLRLAWAITIHKSQGLTFEKAVIDASAAFAPGQVYVALSRCTSLEGLVLLSRINSNSLHTDPRITAFANHKIDETQANNELLLAKNKYQLSLLTDLFNFSSIINSCKNWYKALDGITSSFNDETIPWMNDMEARIIALKTVADKFLVHIKQLNDAAVLPDNNEALQKRLIAAANHFYPLLNELTNHFSTSPAVTDSRNNALTYFNAIKDLFALLAQKKHFIQVLMNGFNTDAFHAQKLQFVLPDLYVNAYAGAATGSKKIDSPHPVLYKQLKVVRDRYAEQDDMQLYLVAASSTLDEMARYLPQTIDELSKISGFGPVKLKRYGKAFLDVITMYCNEHDLASLIHEKDPKRERKEKAATTTGVVKPDTKLESFKLYKSGKTVKEIAELRNFATQTIEGHLAHFVQTGEIKIEELVSREKIILIEPLINEMEGNAITPLKAQLGDAVSFGDIRLVIAWKAFEKLKID